MSGENWLILAFAIGLYPFAVLCVALAGPHNETELRELRQHRKRRKP